VLRRQVVVGVATANPYGPDPANHLSAQLRWIRASAFAGSEFPSEEGTQDSVGYDRRLSAAVAFCCACVGRYSDASLLTTITNAQLPPKRSECYQHLVCFFYWEKWLILNLPDE